LILQTLVPAVRQIVKAGSKTPPELTVNENQGQFRHLEGVDHITNVIQIDQSPLGRSTRSTPATYSGIWTEIRHIFAKTKDAKLRGFSAQRFNLLQSEGRCSRCRGRGIVAVNLKRIQEWAIRCPDCDGSRFNRQTLAIRYRGMSVYDVLNMSIEEAAEFFKNFQRLGRTLDLFRELGLGYIKLGQSSTTLSGGEAQRVKLATQLAVMLPGDSILYVLDEPTTGLHAADVEQLAKGLRRLIESGHSVIAVEHNLDFIRSSDWIIDIGPEPGDQGGQIVVQGPVGTVRKCKSSHTGRALEQLMQSN